MSDKTFRFHVGFTGTIKATSETHAKIRLVNGISVVLGLLDAVEQTNVQVHRANTLDDLIDMEGASG